MMKTKVIYSGILPPKGFIAMCLWPVIIVRKDKAARYKSETDNHEHIHAANAILEWYGEDWVGEPAAYLVGYMTKEIVGLVGEPCA